MMMRAKGIYIFMIKVNQAWSIDKPIIYIIDNIQRLILIANSNQRKSKKKKVVGFIVIDC